MIAVKPRSLLALAREEAQNLATPAAPISWSDALAKAPWPEDGPPAWEAEFRRTFATELVERGAAKPARRGGSSGPSGTTKLARRLLSATTAEFAEQDRRAKAAGLSWSAWARRKLADPD